MIWHGTVMRKSHNKTYVEWCQGTPNLRGVQQFTFQLEEGSVLLGVLENVRQLDA